MAKKSYNPFKMWGSYVGAVLGTYFLGFFAEFFSTINENDFETILENSLIWFSNVVSGAVIPLILGGVILGFIIGYAIHLTVRRLK